jgi:hypothetical protein
MDDKIVQENGLIKYSGRYEEETEYVEFRFPHRRISFVAQKCGEYGWSIYKVWPGASGKFRQITSYTMKQKAIDFAEKEALAFG